MTLRTFIDRHYRLIRRFRFLYGWAKDRTTKAHANKRAEEWKKKGFRGAKLDVCGGRNPFKPGEYLNVDIVDFPSVDLVFDIRKTFPIEADVIAEIISIATLEHLRKPHIHHVLREFHRILAPGGLLRVSTPDIEAIAKAILKNEDPDTINQHLFGKYKEKDTEDLDVHRWMYTAPQMQNTLKDIGFVDIKRIPMDIGMHDMRFTYLIQARKKP